MEAGGSSSKLWIVADDQRVERAGDWLLTLRQPGRTRG